MSAFLLFLGRWCARHATRVLAAWALLIAALGGIVATTGIQLDDTFTISGTESMRGLEVLSDRLPQAAGTSEQVLITSSNGRIENHAPAVNAFALQASQIDGVAMVSPPFGDKATGVPSTVSEDGAHVLVQVQADASVGSITTGTTPKAKTVAQDLDTLAERVEGYIAENGLDIALDYGAFPDRPYDSPGVWGDATKIRAILAADRR